MKTSTGVVIVCAESQANSLAELVTSRGNVGDFGVNGAHGLDEPRLHKQGVDVRAEDEKEDAHDGHGDIDLVSRREESSNKIDGQLNGGTEGQQEWIEVTRRR